MTAITKARRFDHADEPHLHAVPDAEPGPDTTVFDRDQAAAFLTALWADRPGTAAAAFGRDGHRNDHGVYVHASWTERGYRWPDERDRLLDDVDEQLGSGRVDVYVCPHLRAEPRGRRKGGALPPIALHADIDEQLDGDVAALLDTLGPIRVESGTPGHEHAHVLLRDPIPVAVFNRLQPVLRDRLGTAADAKISDNDVLRLPGTWNHKSDPPGPVTLTHTAAQVWDLDKLAALLDVDLAAAEPTAHTGAPAATPAPVPADLPQLVREALQRPYTDRSVAAYGLWGACKSAGLTEGQALTVSSTYAPAVDKYGGRLAAELTRAWPKLEDPHPTGVPQGRKMHPAPPDDHDDDPQGGDRQGDRSPASAPSINLPEEFWQARPALKHIHQAAMHWWACPDAVLAAMLARQASHMGPGDTVDIGLGPGPLNLFAILYGRPSAGKGRAARTAKHTLPRPRHLEGCDYDHHPRWKERPLGSGEGLVEAYFGYVEEPHPTNDAKPGKKIRRQVRRSLMFVVDEGEAFTRKTARQGTTIAQVIRSAWSGETLGDANATAERDRQLDESTYAIGLIILFQPDTIGPLFDPQEVGGGTPLRFLYASAANYLLPKQRPAEPPADPGPLKLPTRRAAATVGDDHATAVHGDMREVPPLRFRLTDADIVDAIQQARWDNLRGDETGDLDGHRSQMHGRVAAILAYWDGGRTDVNGEDWHLAGMVLDTSDAVRDSAIAHGDGLRAAEAEVRTRAHVVREVRTQEAKADAAERREAEQVHRLAVRIARKVRKGGPGGTSRTVLSRMLNGHEREHFNAALSEAAERGWIAGGKPFRPGPNIGEVPDA